MLLLPTTLVLSTWLAVADAGSAAKGESCSNTDNRLQAGTYQFFTDCDSETFCNSQGICELKGCRKDEFPFGYPQNSNVIPPRCPKGQFCPDEQDQCLDVIPVGQPCQFQRDDECEGPPNFLELRDTSNRGLNVNGSICLDYTCMWANKTVGDDCIVENTAFIGYTSDNQFPEFPYIVSRGNCKIGLYCDSTNLKCFAQKQLEESCDADKECLSFNCDAQGKCGGDASATRHVAIWVYIIVAIGIFGGMFGTLFGLYIIHRKQRDTEREKRMQYWREQNAFRQNIMQMRETARNSVTSLGNSTPLYSRDGITSEDSQLPMLGNMKSSALRNEYSDDGMYSDEGHPVMGHNNKF